ncbi:hypothetical protein ACFQX7_07610 [Luedemannella flava]
MLSRQLFRRRPVRLAGVGALAVAMAIVPGVASAGSGKPAPTPAAVVNPDFEDDATGVAAPTGWSRSGRPGPVTPRRAAPAGLSGSPTGRRRRTRWRPCSG